MYIGYDDEQEALRQELRAYYDELLTPEIKADLAREHGIGPRTREIVRQMGKDGWLGIGWPKNYGGQGRSEIEQFVFFDDSMRARAPVPMPLLPGRLESTAPTAASPWRRCHASRPSCRTLVIHCEAARTQTAAL